VKRPPTPPHAWRCASRNDITVFALLLERAKLAHDVDTSSRSTVPVCGPLYVCEVCGCHVVYGHYVDDHGDTRWGINLYGVDVDSMAPMRTPGCELLCRPGTLDEDDDDNAVQLQLRGVA
jgi:hypothetical protein